jgi:hypothetical protein
MANKINEVSIDWTLTSRSPAGPLEPAVTLSGIHTPKYDRLVITESELDQVVEALKSEMETARQQMLERASI